MESTQADQQKENERNEDRLKKLWNKTKCPNICILGVPEEKERK